MANIILFSHGQLATGLADSCKLIIGENHFKVLNILLDQNIQEIKNNLDPKQNPFRYYFDPYNNTLNQGQYPESITTLII